MKTLINNARLHAFPFLFNLYDMKIQCRQSAHVIEANPFLLKDEAPTFTSLESIGLYLHIKHNKFNRKCVEVHWWIQTIYKIWTKS
jgi:hypothetical protein